MNKEKSAFPVVTDRSEGNYAFNEGITYRQYLAARVYPEMIKQMASLEHWQTAFEEAAKLTWQAVDALIKAEEANNGKDSN